METTDIKSAVKQHKNEIIAAIQGAKGDYRICIYDPLGAFIFKKYAISETWDENHFEIAFEDAKNTAVGIEDFIEYQLYFSKTAIELESRVSQDELALEVLREEQNTIKEQLLSQFIAEEENA